MLTKFIFFTLRFTGIPFLFREIIQRNKVTILLFHDIDIKTAQKTFKMLDKKYNIISLQDYINAVKLNDFTNIPKKALIITFDDGHIQNFELIETINNKNIPITIFLCAGIIGTNRQFWFKNDSISSIQKESLKNVSNDERLKMLYEVGFDQTKEFKHPQALLGNQINQMIPIVDFQSHTLFHPCLPNCDDEDARKEIFKSKEILENIYNLNVNTISYPNGDYCERDIDLVKKAGYECGITVDFGYNSKKPDLFRLKRLSVNDTQDVNELLVKASGIWAFIRTSNGKRQKYGFNN